jgi:hypothetical protein
VTPQPPDATLTPPLALRDTCQILREVIAVYDSSLVDESERETDFAKLLEKAVGPAVEMCERMAGLGRGGEWEKDIFLINCLGYLQVHPPSGLHLACIPRRCQVVSC